MKAQTQYSFTYKQVEFILQDGIRLKYYETHESIKDFETEFAVLILLFVDIL